ncbi:MAG: HAD family hydrolase [Bacteroidota bacterium]
MKHSPLKVDKSWTLFLDRDGVINKKLPGDYVRNISEFEVLPGVKESIARLQNVFGLVIVITNQQGVGKGIMTADDVNKVHDYMCSEIAASGGNIHDVFFCPDLDGSGSRDRKPAIGMGLQAKDKFPEIDFSRTLMVGDSITDMEFGKKLDLTTVFIQKEKDTQSDNNPLIDYVFTSLKEFSDFIYESNPS